MYGTWLSVSGSPYFEAIRDFSQPVLEYAPSPGIPQLIQAVQGYYSRIGIDYGEGDILVTTGGSEALQIALSCILDTDDEILIPEPFYPNYNTFVNCAGGKIVPIPTTPEEGYLIGAIAIDPLLLRQNIHINTHFFTHLV